ncbi:cutinase family protein [Actinomycetes bacterium M1A6_2h]
MTDSVRGAAAVLAAAVLCASVASAGVASADPAEPGGAVPGQAPLQVSDGPPKVDLPTILGIAPKSNELNLDPNNYAQTCPDVLIVALSGGSDTSVDKNPLDEEARLPLQNWIANLTVPTGEANASTPNRVGWLYVPYPATDGIGVGERNPTYQDSTAAGVASTNRILNENKAKCGTATKYVIVGYSIGAEVAERVSVDIGSRPDDAPVNASDILGVGLVGDPYRPAGTPSINIPGPPGGGFMSSEPKDYGALADKMLWACRPYDLSCDAPKNIAILPLLLGVFGQVHWDPLDPVTTVSELANSVSGTAARSIAYIFAHPDFATSEESALDVVLRESDRTEPRGDADPQPTQAQVLSALQWAAGPGREVVNAKLNAERVGFAEDNADIAKLITEPYIAFGFLQHLTYWNALPGREWESDKMIRWITTLAQQDADRKNAEASSTPAPQPAAPTTEPAAPQSIPPVAPGSAAPPAQPQVTIDDSFGSLLQSFGIGPQPAPIKSVP